MRECVYTIKKFSFIGLAALFLVAGCSSTSTAPAPEQSQEPQAVNQQENTAESKPSTQAEVFRVGYLPTTMHALTFIAKDLGYFAEENLDVELFEFVNSGEGINAIQAGKIDVGSFGTAAPLSFIDRGAELTVIGGAAGAGSGVVALPEREQEFKDLQGFKSKKVGTVKLATGDAVWRKALFEAGLNLQEDLEIVELDSPASVMQAVKNGSVDAGVLWPPFVEMAGEQGLAIVTYTGDYFEDHPCCRHIVLNKNIQDRYDEYVRFTRALIRAEQFYQEDKQGTVDIIANYVKIDKQIIAKDMEKGEMLISADPNKHGVEGFWEGMQNVGYVQSTGGVSDHINTLIYEEALSSLLAEDPENAFLLQQQETFAKNNL